MKTYSEITEMDETIEHWRRKYLLAHGWTESCAFPDCRWRWCKEINGQRITLRMYDAFEMEGRFVSPEVTTEGGE